MKLRNIAFVLVAGIFFVGVSSCIKDDSEELRAEEKKVFEQYILANNINVTPTETGLYYIETQAGTGDKAQTGKWIEINYTGRLVSNNRIVMTSDIQIAKENNLYQENVYFGPTRLILGSTPYDGLNQGILLMKEGGKSRMIFPSDLAIGGNSTPIIPAYSSFIFDIELLNVIYSPRRFEDSLMMEYLTANEFSLDSTDTGIYIKETEAGDGAFAVKYNEVTVSYTGKFLNGKVFDGTDKSFSFTVGTGAVIPGFEEGVKLIKKNGSATVVIPYYYAYGETGRIDNQYRSVIPPFTTLVFDLTVTNIVTK